jgi:alkanesulfonate monooxygenase
MPRIQVAFQPFIAATEKLVWEKAYRTVDAIKLRTAGGKPLTRRHSLTAPENTGSQRPLALVAQGRRFDRALWTPTAAATGGAGNSNALVGTSETVAQALLDYYDVSVEILSARGYDPIDSAGT